MDVLANIKEVFANNLRTLRGERTQAAMAEQLGIPFPSYKNLESGQFMPSHANVAIIAERLRIDEARLFADPAAISRPTRQQALDAVRRDIDILLELSPTQLLLFEILPSMDEDQARRFIELFETHQRTLARHSTPLKKRDQG